MRQDVHIRWPHGSIFTSLSFSAHILHSWNVEPISQYNSYCSLGKETDRHGWYCQITSMISHSYKKPNTISAEKKIPNTRTQCKEEQKSAKISLQFYVLDTSVKLWKKCASSYPRFSFRCPKNSLGNQGSRHAGWHKRNNIWQNILKKKIILKICQPCIKLYLIFAISSAHSYHSKISASPVKHNTSALKTSLGDTKYDRIV